jgi:uncharacterized membrane protein HdeD (DUF308 family)
MTEENNLTLRLNKSNLWWIGAGVIVIIIGFALMMGPVSEEGCFEQDIYSVRRIVVAPVIVFFGYLSVIVSLFYKPKNKKK